MAYAAMQQDSATTARRWLGCCLNGSAEVKSGYKWIVEGWRCEARQRQCSHDAAAASLYKQQCCHSSLLLYSISICTSVRVHQSCGWPFDGPSSLALRSLKREWAECIVPGLSGTNGRAERVDAQTEQDGARDKGGESIFDFLWTS